MYNHHRSYFPNADGSLNTVKMQPSSLGCSYLALHRDLSTFKDLNHLIWTVKIRFKRSRFDLWFDFNFCDSVWKKGLNRDKSDACLPTQNEMHESSKHFCFGCDLMLKLHRTDIVSTVTVQSISRVIRPKIHFVKYQLATSQMIKWSNLKSPFFLKSQIFHGQISNQVSNLSQK